MDKLTNEIKNLEKKVNARTSEIERVRLGIEKEKAEEKEKQAKSKKDKAATGEKKKQIGYQEQIRQIQDFRKARQQERKDLFQEYC